MRALPLLLLILGGLRVVGCTAGEMTTHPTVVLDSDFSAAEVAQVRAGLGSWERKGPAVSFAIEVASDRPSFVQEAESSPAANTVYMLREKGHLCPFAYTALTPVVPIAFTIRNANGSSVTCFDADRLDAAETGQPNVFKAVAAHEMGHSFGLVHDDIGVTTGTPESVMTTYHQDEPADGEVTCVDARVVESHFGGQLPAACAK